MSCVFHLGGHRCRRSLLRETESWLRDYRSASLTGTQDTNICWGSMHGRLSWPRYPTDASLRSQVALHLKTVYAFADFLRHLPSRPNQTNFLLFLAKKKKLSGLRPKACFFLSLFFLLRLLINWCLFHRCFLNFWALYLWYFWFYST